MNILWDADEYTKDFSFVHEYGNSVAELVNYKEGSTVMDLGCGNGALTKAFCDKGFAAIGIDGSAELLNIAKKHYPDIEFIQADAANFTLDKLVDVVFSNAVFHWIEKEKQMSMLNCVFKALKGNGQFVFEFGGKGNNAMIHGALQKAFAENGCTYKMPFYFPSIGEYAPLLEKAGFKVTYAVLFDRPTELKGENGLKDWMKMFVKTPFTDIDPCVKDRILDQAVEELRGGLCVNGKWYADYVRLRMKAIKE